MRAPPGSLGPGLSTDFPVLASSLAREIKSTGNFAIQRLQPSDII